jgi:hypothetical protein
VSILEIDIDFSTGGVIALGLGVENWPIDKCISHFMKFIDKAFTTRLGGFRLGTSKYRTRPLEDALKTCFKNEKIFGGIHESSKSYARKVAVTAASETGEQAVIFSNYSRAADEQSRFFFYQITKYGTNLR